MKIQWHTQQPFNPQQRRLFTGVNQCDGLALALGPASAANPVNVIVGVAGNGSVDHQVELWHIDAPAGHIGCHEVTQISSLELVHGIDPAVLPLVGMQCLYRP